MTHPLPREVSVPVAPGELGSPELCPHCAGEHQTFDPDIGWLSCAQCLEPAPLALRELARAREFLARMRAEMAAVERQRQQAQDLDALLAWARLTLSTGVYPCDCDSDSCERCQAAEVAARRPDSLLVFLADKDDTPF